MGKGRVEKGNMEEDWGGLGPGMGHLLYISTNLRAQEVMKHINFSISHALHIKENLSAFI